MQIHFFNPDHDIALALNQRRFSTPHAGRQMRSDLGYIPALWAEDEDVVVVEDIESAELLYRRHNLKTRAKVKFITLEQLQNGVYHDYTICPWGWNKSIRTTFLDAKMALKALPTDKDLDIIRSLSNRSLAVQLLKLYRGTDGIVGNSHVCYNIDKVDNLLRKYGNIVVKAPWSSSGRGIRYININDDPNENTRKWILNTLEKQGTVIVERKCLKVFDFAMEFLSSPDGDVTYQGLSLFTTKNGAYTGNLLLSEEEKEEYIARYVSPTLLNEVQRRTEVFLAKNIKGAYSGPLGVDMMVCRDWDADNTSNMLNPCIEINLRRTMGHVALALSRRGQRGTMSIDYDGKNYRFHLRQ